MRHLCIIGWMLALTTIVVAEHAQVHTEELVVYPNCGEPLCPGLSAFQVASPPPPAYRCDCTRTNEHPDCGCPQNCDCSKPTPHPACGCLSVVLPSNVNPCASGGCDGDFDGFPSLPFSPALSVPQPLPPIHESLCRPNVANIGPGTCRRGTTNNHCTDTSSNCAAACPVGDYNCFQAAHETDCDCREPAPAPCECVNSSSTAGHLLQPEQGYVHDAIERRLDELQQEQMLKHQMEQQQLLAMLSQQQQQQQQQQQHAGPHTAGAASVDIHAVPQPQEAAGHAQIPAHDAAHDPSSLQAQLAQVQAQAHVEAAHLPSNIGHSEDIKTYEAAREAALKAQEALHAETENLKKQQEALKQEEERIQNMEKHMSAQRERFMEMKEAEMKEEAKDHEEEAKFESEEHEVVEVEHKAKALLEDIKHQAEQAVAHIDPHTNPGAASQVQFDQRQLDELIKSIEKLSHETDNLNQEHIKLREHIHAAAAHQGGAHGHDHSHSEHSGEHHSEEHHSEEHHSGEHHSEEHHTTDNHSAHPAASGVSAAHTSTSAAAASAAHPTVAAAASTTGPAAGASHAEDHEHESEEH